MKIKDISSGKVKDEKPVPRKKPYKVPTLLEYGVITDLVNRRVINGRDGGLPIDNDT